ncbi:hypothetical protein DB31_0173 [Hyalangium minutum]|uniref:Uncharacterized protein n=1 Tax=Hyalangium minutum TaxID=394096 RepID=A0A085WW49_9BACT|nr:hypothetical protein DB31_0173 [Hyalangium minutum]
MGHQLRLRGGPRPDDCLQAEAPTKTGKVGYVAISPKYVDAQKGDPCSLG